MNAPRSLRSPRKLLLGLLIVLGAHACGDPSAAPAASPTKTKGLTFVQPTPAPIEILWVDSAGNMGFRGVDAAFNGVPPPESKVSDACRASATKNGAGTLTLCFTPQVGDLLKGLEWTSPSSAKP